MDAAAAILAQEKQTAAALFLGFMCASIGYGTGCLQMIIYGRNSRRDSMRFRALVWFLWICDTAHMALIAHALYHYFVASFGNPLALAVPIWSLTAEQSVSIVVEFIVRSVFTGRVWKLSKHSVLLTSLLSVFNVGVFGLGGYFSYRAFRAKSFYEFIDLKWLVVANLAGHLLADFSITVTLACLLRKSRTGFDTMDSVLKTLVGFVIQSGVATMLVSAMVLATFLVNMQSLIFIGIYFVLCKVFFNALLASLNARSNILANTLEAGVSMTVLSTRHRGEESRKDYDGFYHMQTPTNSVPDLRSLNGDVRRHSRRPSVRSHRRGSSRQDGMAEVPCTPRSAPPSIRSHRPSASTHGRPGDASLIPELPKFTHRIHLDGRGSEVVSSNPLHGSIDTTSSPFPIQPEFSTESEETDLPYLSLPTSPVRYPSFLPY